MEGLFCHQVPFSCGAADFRLSLLHHLPYQLLILQNILVHLMTHGNHVYQKERVLLKQESEREGVRPWEEGLEFALSLADIGGGS